MENKVYVLSGGANPVGREFPNINIKKKLKLQGVRHVEPRT